MKYSLPDFIFRERENKMFELKIDENTYKFNFGIGFMKDMNKRHKEDAKRIFGENARANQGLSIGLSNVFIDDDIEEFIEMLLLANKTFDPKVSRETIVNYIDNDENDIDELLDTVKNSLSSSNSCKKEMKRVEELLKEIEKETAEESQSI